MRNSEDKTGLEAQGGAKLNAISMLNLPDKVFFDIVG
jgi:hypothetical protein